MRAIYLLRDIFNLPYLPYQPFRIPLPIDATYPLPYLQLVLNALQIEWDRRRPTLVDGDNFDFHTHDYLSYLLTFVMTVERGARYPHAVQHPERSRRRLRRMCCCNSRLSISISPRHHHDA